MKHMRSPMTAVLLAVAMMIGILSVATPADAVVNTGTIIPTPSPTFQGNTLWAVSCTSSTWCMSAGMQVSDNTLIEFDNGTATQVTNPNPGKYGRIWGLSCDSATHCIAVGTQNAANFAAAQYATQILEFDGAAWTLATSPNLGAGDNLLNSVSCTSATSCMAVGRSNSGRPPYTAASQTMAMTWDGTNWTIVNSPNIGAGDNELRSVSCTSSTSCMAVGRSNSGIEPYTAASQTIAMTWDGTNWTTVNTPDIGAGDNELRSVSCTSATSCVAVGDHDYLTAPQALSMRWDGSNWISMTGLTGTGENRLTSVSCVSSTMCVAVGTSDTYTLPIPLMATWDGANWTEFAGPSSSDGIYSEAISCSSETSCLVSGSQGYPNKNLLIALSDKDIAPTSTTTSSDPVAPAFTG